MSMYMYDYGFSNQAISDSLYGRTINYDDDELYFRRPPPPLRHSPPVTSPINHRHDGTSPLPLGMDWSLPPRVWEGRNSVWPHDSNKGWSYCVTVPSWTIVLSTSGSDAVFFRVQVGVQSPEGITSTQEVLRRFNEFWKLYSDLRTEFPKKYLPLPPQKSLMKMRSNTLLEVRRCALEGWVEKLLSDIDVSRTALVAMFLELEAAARKSCSELTPVDRVTNLVPSDQLPCNSANSLLSSSSSISSDIDSSSGSKKATKIEQNEILQKELDNAKATKIEQNEILQKELDNAKEQIETLRKSKADVKLLVKEVKSLRKSNLELKHELTKCLEEKAQLENEKQQWEAGDSAKVALLRECEHLCNRLRDCSVNFILDEEDKLMSDTSLSDAIDLLETSDSQISSLLAEVQFLGQDDESSNGPASDIFISRDGDLRTLLSDILTENAMLRKQVNSVIRQALTKPGNTPKDEAEDDPIM